MDMHVTAYLDDKFEIAQLIIGGDWCVRTTHNLTFNIATDVHVVTWGEGGR